MFGSKRNELIEEGWTEFDNEDLYYSSPNIITMVMSRRRIYAGHVARMREEKCMKGFDGKLNRRNSLRRPRRS
jgi:hypothetical protein